MLRNKLYYENRLKLLSNRTTDCQRIIAKIQRQIKQLEKKEQKG